MITAAAAGHRHVVSLLIRDGADVNARDQENRTALMRAVAREDLKLARLLIRMGSKVNARGPGGDTALHIAIRRGGEKMFWLLLNAGADIFHRRYDAGQRGAWDIAKVWKRRRFIEILDELAGNASQPIRAPEEGPSPAKDSAIQRG
jgi:hypothetical protein